MKQRNKAVPAAFAVLEKDGKVLLMRRANTGYQDGKYDLPAGHVEEGELPSAAIVREVKEELDIDVAQAGLQSVHVMYKPKHDPTGDRVNIYFRASAWSGNVVIMEPEKCDDASWFALDALPQNMIPDIREALLCIAKGIAYKEMSIEWLKQNGLYSL